MCDAIKPRNKIRIIGVWFCEHLCATRQLQTVHVGLTKDKVLGGIIKTEAICPGNCRQEDQTLAGYLLHLHESHQLWQFTSRRLLPLFFCSEEVNATILEVNFPPPSTPYAN
jgi:hypothetical protein